MNRLRIASKWPPLALLALAACSPPAAETNAEGANAAVTTTAEAPAEDSAPVENASALPVSAAPPVAEPAVAEPPVAEPPVTKPPVAKTAAQPAPTPKPAPAPAPQTYTARGQEPGWALSITGGRLDYQGNYGEKRIKAVAPEPRPTAKGRRYVTRRLTVEITHGRCNDAMSGHGYADEVTIVADGETYSGCGGARRTDWDN